MQVCKKRKPLYEQKERIDWQLPGTHIVAKKNDVEFYRAELFSQAVTFGKFCPVFINDLNNQINFKRHYADMWEQLQDVIMINNWPMNKFAIVGKLVGERQFDKLENREAKLRIDDSSGKDLILEVSISLEQYGSMFPESNVNYGKLVEIRGFFRRRRPVVYDAAVLCSTPNDLASELLHWNIRVQFRRNALEKAWKFDVPVQGYDVEDIVAPHKDNDESSIRDTETVKEISPREGTLWEVPREELREELKKGPRGEPREVPPREVPPVNARYLAPIGKLRKVVDLTGNSTLRQLAEDRKVQETAGTMDTDFTTTSVAFSVPIGAKRDTIEQALLNNKHRYIKLVKESLAVIIKRLFYEITLDELVSDQTVLSQINLFANTLQQANDCSNVNFRLEIVFRLALYFRESKLFEFTNNVIYLVKFELMNRSIQRKLSTRSQIKTLKYVDFLMKKLQLTSCDYKLVNYLIRYNVLTSNLRWKYVKDEIKWVKY